MCVLISWSNQTGGGGGYGSRSRYGEQQSRDQYGGRGRYSNYDDRRYDNYGDYYSHSRYSDNDYYGRSRSPFRDDHYRDYAGYSC